MITFRTLLSWISIFFKYKILEILLACMFPYFFALFFPYFIACVDHVLNFFFNCGTCIKARYSCQIKQQSTNFILANQASSFIGFIVVSYRFQLIGIYSCYLFTIWNSNLVFQPYYPTNWYSVIGFRYWIFASCKLYFAPFT